jgi:sarcosine oxidase subunit gamma
MTQPADHLRRSFLYRTLGAAGARWEVLADAAVAADYGDPEGEWEIARRLGLADLSPLPRTGFKGPGTADWLAGQGIDVPPDSNRAARQESGVLACRLAPGEVLLLGPGSGEGEAIAALDEAWKSGPVPPEQPRGFPVPRRDSHAWFRVTGDHAAAMFAKLCAVDLRPTHFADLSIAQTSVARSAAVVVRDDIGALPAFHLLCDSAMAGYLWECLIDAMAEFDGHPVGRSALLALA